MQNKQWVTGGWLKRVGGVRDLLLFMVVFLAANLDEVIVVVIRLWYLPFSLSLYRTRRESGESIVKIVRLGKGPKYGISHSKDNTAI